MRSILLFYPGRRSHPVAPASHFLGPRSSREVAGSGGRNCRGLIIAPEPVGTYRRQYGLVVADTVFPVVMPYAFSADTLN